MAATEEERVIVIAMDGSEYSDHALHWYMDNIHRKTDKVILVHCPEYHSIIQSPMMMADVTVLTDLYREEEKRIKDFLECLGKKLKDHGIGGKVKSIGGSPGEVVCQVAEQDCASMIITGTRGMGTIRRTLVGSVSDYIIHHAHVPVVVCRMKGHHHHHHQKQEQEKEQQKME